MALPKSKKKSPKTMTKADDDDKKMIKMQAEKERRTAFVSLIIEGNKRQQERWAKQIKAAAKKEKFKLPEEEPEAMLTVLSNMTLKEEKKKVETALKEKTFGAMFTVLKTIGLRLSAP
jgi:hypothetical protein